MKNANSIESKWKKVKSKEKKTKKKKQKEKDEKPKTKIKGMIRKFEECAYYANKPTKALCKHSQGKWRWRDEFLIYTSERIVRGNAATSKISMEILFFGGFW